MTVYSCHVKYAFQSESTLSHSIVAWMSRNSLLEAGAKSENWIRTQNRLVCKQTLNHLAKPAKWLSCVLTVCSCHVRYAFQSESTLYSQMHTDKCTVQISTQNTAQSFGKCFFHHHLHQVPSNYYQQLFHWDHHQGDLDLTLSVEYHHSFPLAFLK